MSHLTDIILDCDEDTRHSITRLLSEHVVDLVQGKEDQIHNIHSQYHSLIRQYFKPYQNKTKYENVELAMIKAYNKLKIDYAHEKLT